MDEVNAKAGGGNLLLKFEGKLISTKHVTALLKAIEDELKDDEISEAQELCDSLEISPMIRDAVLYRLKDYDVDRFYIEAVRPGSFEILAVIAASTYFILERTIGESIKAGFVSSELHIQIKEWIARRIDEKVARLTRNLPDNYRIRELHISASTDEQSGLTTIVVPQRTQDEERAPPLVQLALPPPKSNESLPPPK